MKYIIGSRGSRLALIQTKYVQEKLAKAYPEHTFEIQIIKTKGDKIQNKPLDKIGGVENLILADKDRDLPYLKDFIAEFGAF